VTAAEQEQVQVFVVKGAVAGGALNFAPGFGLLGVELGEDFVASLYCQEAALADDRWTIYVKRAGRFCDRPARDD